MSKQELRIQELEEELIKQKDNQYGNGGLFSSMIASPDYHFDADKNNGIEQEHSDDEVIEKVYSNNYHQDEPIYQELSENMGDFPL